MINMALGQIALCNQGIGSWFVGTFIVVAALLSTIVALMITKDSK